MPESGPRIPGPRRKLLDGAVRELERPARDRACRHATGCAPRRAVRDGCQAGRERASGAECRSMRRVAFLGMVLLSLVAVRPALGANGSVAALQIGLRAQGLYGGTIDGVGGPLTKAGVHAPAADARHQGDGACRREDAPRAGRARGAAARSAPALAGARRLGRLRRSSSGSSATGSPRAAVDGRFDVATAGGAAAVSAAHGLTPDGIAGKQTFRALAHTVVPRHEAGAGSSSTSSSLVRASSASRRATASARGCSRSRTVSG